MEIIWLLEFLLCIGQFFFVHFVVKKATHNVNAGKPERQLILFIITVAFSLLSSLLFVYLWGFTVMGICFYPYSVFAALFSIFKTFTPGVRESITTFLETGKQRRLIPYFLLTRIILPAACIFPLIGGNYLMQQCDAFHRDTGNIIYHAIQNYELENGKKPDTLEALIPKYLQKIPSATCNLPIHWAGSIIQTNDLALYQRSDYSITTCSDGLTVLDINSIPFDQPQVLNLNSGKWSYGIGDTLDDSWEQRVCNGASSLN
jgi:hypothetical protein